MNTKWSFWTLFSLFCIF